MDNLNRYVGHPSQLVRVNDYKMVGGAADGLRATDIQNGAVSLTVTADKGMDFPYFSYKGINFGFITQSGMVSPQYYDDKGNGFLRAFNAGFLTTCGLTNMGATCDDGDIHYGMHGRVNNTPAEQYSACLVGDGAGTAAVVQGDMREAVLFGEHLVMRRQVKCAWGQKGFSFTDTVSNRGFKRTRHMILYHFNLGYPLLDEGVEVWIPSSKSEPRDPHAATGYSSRLQIPAPVPGYEEMCYFHSLKKDGNGRTGVGVYNPRLQVGVAIYYDAALLDGFTQWKMVAEGEYVLGLEPGNATCLGVVKEEELGHVKYLEPGGSVQYAFDIAVIDGDAAWQDYKKETGAYT